MNTSRAATVPLYSALGSPLILYQSVSLSTLINTYHQEHTLRPTISMDIHVHMHISDLLTSSSRRLQLPLSSSQ